MSKENPPISRREVIDILNKLIERLEEYITETLLTKKEQNSFERTLFSIQDAGSQILACLPSRKNNETYNRRGFKKSKIEFSLFWSKFKLKVQTIQMKSPEQLCLDLIPDVLRRLGSAFNEIIDSIPYSNKNEFINLSTKLSELFSDFETKSNEFLDAIRADHEIIENAKIYKKIINRYRREVFKNFEQLFRIQALTDEDKTNAISAYLDKIELAVSYIGTTKSKALPKFITDLEKSLKDLLVEEELDDSMINSLLPGSLNHDSPSKMLSSKVEKIKSAQKSPRQSVTTRDLTMIESRSSVIDEEQQIKQLTSDAIRTEKENQELELELRNLELSNNLSNLDSLIEELLKLRISKLNSQINTMQDNIKAANDRLTENNQLFMQQCKRLQEEENKLSELYSQSTISDDSTGNKQLIKQKQSLEKELQHLSQRLETLINDTSNFKKTSESLVTEEQSIRNQIRNLKNEGKDLDLNLDSLQSQTSMYSKYGDELFNQITQHINEESNQLSYLIRTKSELEDDIIPELQETLKITNKELSRVSKQINELKQNYNSARIEHLKKNLQELLD